MSSARRRPTTPPGPSQLAAPCSYRHICQQSLYRQEASRANRDARQELHQRMRKHKTLCQWAQKSAYAQSKGRVYWISCMNWTIWLEEESGWGGGDLAEPREDDEWVVTRSPFGASAHQNKACEQCLLGKRVCGLWSCDKRHLSPTDREPHTQTDAKLFSVCFCLFYSGEHTSVPM